MDAFFIKLPNGDLRPATDHDRELLKKIKTGQPTRLTFVRVRNYEFHKKYFALLQFAFDYWEPSGRPPLKDGWPDPVKNFDTFRSDIIILAGFHDVHYRLNGDLRVKARSIAFANMTEDDFEKLYAKTIDVIIKHVLAGYTGKMLRETVEMAEGFE